MNSPKGKFRMVGTGVLAVIMMVLIALAGGYDSYGVWHAEDVLNPSGWVFKQLNNIGEICIGLVALYAGHRTINHFRTHEILEETGRHTHPVVMALGIGWILAIAYVVGNAIR